MMLKVIIFMGQVVLIGFLFGIVILVQTCGENIE